VISAQLARAQICSWVTQLASEPGVSRKTCGVETSTTTHSIKEP
jgi:hypothetical protein